jgi:phosphoglycerate dehydrogenase-like enzyme
MKAATRLRFWATTSASIRDVGYATEIGLPIIFTPIQRAVRGEHTILQLLAISKRVREADAAVRAGHYDIATAANSMNFPTRRSLIGFGAPDATRQDRQGGLLHARSRLMIPTSRTPCSGEGVERQPIWPRLLASRLVSLHLQLTPKPAAS